MDEWMDEWMEGWRNIETDYYNSQYIPPGTTCRQIQQCQDQYGLLVVYTRY